MTGLQVENAIDLHCHFSPDALGGRAVERGIDLRTGTSVVQSARDAVASGQAGVVLKSHSFASPALAAALSELFPELHVFGGICTDHLTAGLNVPAVEAALSMGAKIVWLPTINSAQDHGGHGNVAGYEDPGLSVIDERGRVIPSVHEIFELVRQYDAVLATGHISMEEHHAVVSEFARRGKVVVTHAGEPRGGPNLSREKCVELADMGAIIEFTAFQCTDFLGVPGNSPGQTAAVISAVGVHRCVLSSDYGFMKDVPPPVSGLRNFLERMWLEGGLSEADLSVMASRTPAELLNLEL